ncbi:MAG: sulfite exporter TauE/SafE family protein [Salinibacter sp.]|uniref:sulfite exporter TauE/SafE family protein n=1 Tax=Salinibacter sp. TaxID=2065818 RepID=UPI0035D41029
MSFEFWYMLPIGIVVTTVGMASGIGGATFYAPLFILGLGLSPRLAIASGLVVEGFGFSSGMYAYIRRRLVDYKIGGTLLMATVPAALVGTTLSHYVEVALLKIMLGMGLLAVAMSFFRAPGTAIVNRLEALAREAPETAETCLTTARGEEICYTVCNKVEGCFISGVGGFFMGLVSSGLGELNSYFLLQRCRVPSSVSVATTVFVVAVTALAASSGHVVQLMQNGPDKLTTMGNLLLFTVPGVIIGAQFGPALAERVPDRWMEIGLGILLTITAALLIAEAGLLY